MAISKIKAIKSTPEKAIAYIMNPEKTEGGLLVSSFGCAPETAALEFQLTAKKGRQTGNRLAYHLMQAFAPEDDITPEKAHELGMEFAKKVTGGKYEFVVTTHIDKGHIHNHIIFNATSFVDRKKYHYGPWEKNRIRSINDRICKENNLSVIEKYSGRRGKGKYEYNQSKKKTSWKDRLADAIDSAILKASDFDEFLSIMEMEGYEVKHGKYIAFKITWQGEEHVTRAKTIGDAYTEDAIKDRIAHKDKTVESYKSSDPSPEQKQETKTTKRPDPARINLLVDISKNIKAQESKGYERALLKSNIDNLVKSMNYLIRHNIVTPENFSAYESEINADYESTRKSILQLSDELLDLSAKINHVKNYKKNKSVYEQSLKKKGDQEFYVQHEDEILEYQTALRYFEYHHISLDEVNKTKLHDMFEKYKSMKEEVSDLKKKSVPLKNAYKELGIVKKNIEDALGISLNKNDGKGKDGKANIYSDTER